MRLAASAEEKPRPSDPQKDEKKRSKEYKKKKGKRRKLLADIKLLIYIFRIQSLTKLGRQTISQRTRRGKSKFQSRLD